MDRERGSLCPTGSHPRAGVPLGAPPAPIGPELAPSTHRRHSPFVSAPLARLVAPGIVAGILITVGLATAAAAGASPRPAGAELQAATERASLPLSLSAQTAYVAPGQPFDVRVQAGRGSPPVADLGLNVAVYACLSSVSAFDQSMNSATGPPGTRISATRSPVPLSGLPVSGGVYDLSMQVNQGGSSAATSAGAYAIDLMASGAQCGAYPLGVYPVRIELVDTTSGQVLGGFTTHLIYVNPQAGTRRLQVALVLPVETTLRPAVTPAPSVLRARPGAALAPPSAAAVGAVTATVDLLADGHPSVPVTIEASPQTVELLSSTGHQATVNQLASLAAAASPSAHQFAESPFVPVDAASLVDAGLQVELNLQVAQGAQILDTAVTRPSGTQGGGAGPGKLGTWFSDAALDPATLTQLQVAGYDQRGAAGHQSLLRADQRVHRGAVHPQFDSGHGHDRAGLQQLTSRHGSPPQRPTRCSPPTSWWPSWPRPTTRSRTTRPHAVCWPSPRAVGPTILSSSTPCWARSSRSPILQPVTTATLFDTLGPATSCRTCRLGTTASTGNGGLPVTAIQTQRQRINGLAAAAPAVRQGVGTQLSEVVLSGQSENLRPSQQSAVLANASTAIDAQLAQIAVAGDRTITLTSQRGQVPVSVVSAAPYTVTASMTLTSDKLLFANHSTSITLPITLTPARTTVKYVNVQSRASGSFKVAIVLRSPVGGMVLSSGQVSVRSTATSVVGILLSVGAVVVLAAWWIRTSRKRRRAGRAEVPIDQPAEPVVTG